MNMGLRHDARAVLDMVGLPDETTEVGADDLELSWRLRLHVELA